MDWEPGMQCIDDFLDGSRSTFACWPIGGAVSGSPRNSAKVAMQAGLLITRQWTRKGVLLLMCDF